MVERSRRCRNFGIILTAVMSDALMECKKYR